MLGHAATVQLHLLEQLVMQLGGRVVSTTLRGEAVELRVALTNEGGESTTIEWCSSGVAEGQERGASGRFLPRSLAVNRRAVLGSMLVGGGYGEYYRSRLTASTAFVSRPDYHHIMDDLCRITEERGQSCADAELERVAVPITEQQTAADRVAAVVGGYAFHQCTHEVKVACADGAWSRRRNAPEHQLLVMDSTGRKVLSATHVMRKRRGKSAAWNIEHQRTYVGASTNMEGTAAELGFMRWRDRHHTVLRACCNDQDAKVPLIIRSMIII
jgi:hypothetical protein